MGYNLGVYWDYNPLAFDDYPNTPLRIHRPLPIFVELMVETSHPQNRIIGEIPDS